MDGSVSNEVLRRKAQSGREEHQARVMSPARALRIALSRAADDLFDLALTVSGVQCEQLGQDAMLRCIDEEMLLVVLDGPQGAVGAVAVDLSVLAGLIEQQTMGRVLPTEPEARAPTSTDAALIAPIVDMVLEGITTNLGPEDGRMTEGFRFGARLESKRHLGLLVEAADFHVIRTQLELDGGAKRGEFVLVVPLEAAPALPAPLETSEGAGPDSKPLPAHKSFLQSALMEAPASLDAIIHREKITLAALSKLKVGDRLPLPENALSKLELGKGTGAQRLGPCHLGQHNGVRAVQLRFAVRAGARGSLGEELAEFFSEHGDIGDDAGLGPVGESSAGLEAGPLFTPDDFPIEEGADAPQQASPAAPPVPDLSDLPGFEPEDMSEAS